MTLLSNIILNIKIYYNLQRSSTYASIIPLVKHMIFAQSILVWQALDSDLYGDDTIAAINL